MAGEGANERERKRRRGGRKEKQVGCTTFRNDKEEMNNFCGARLFENSQIFNLEHTQFRSNK